MRPKLSLLVVLLLASLLPPPSAADPSPLRPRVIPDKRSYARLPETTRVAKIVVKFHEGTAVRLRAGWLTANERNERDRRDLQSHGLAPAAVERDAAEVQRLAGLAPLSPAANGIQRLFSLPEETLAERRERGEARSGRQLADLALYYELPLAPGVAADDVAALVDALNALPSVEIAYAQPPAEPATLPLSKPAAGVSFPNGPTPSFQSQQGYLNAAPQGIDALYAWTQAGGKGQGIKVIDIEGDWRATHEDMPPLFHTGGPLLGTLYWRNHGTAVLGVIGAKSNGSGVTGIAHEAQIGYQSFGINLDNAILAASEATGSAGVGGVVLIELHAQGPTTSYPCDCNPGQCHYVPMEYFQGTFDAIANATANGTVVVEAGGNGSTNLDDPAYGSAFDRNLRDSGAIVVGASNSINRGPTCWTNWGSRIDLHGWGEHVVTLGYGDLFNGGTEDRWYTGFFNGTSSASPIVTGAVASLQGRALAALTETLDPLVLRDMLKNTGTPYTGTRHIGPLPNLRAAFDVLDDYQPPTCYTLTRSFTGSGRPPLASPPRSNGCPPEQFVAGEDIALTPRPAIDWFLTGWTGTTSGPSLTMPSGPATVTAHYGTTPLDFYTVTPCRVVDTPQLGWLLHSGSGYGFFISGRCGVPASAKAVAVTITAVSPTANGHLTLWPSHVPKPQTSSVNFHAGEARASNAIMPLSPDGLIDVQSFLADGGTVHMLLDVTGYFQ